MNIVSCVACAMLFSATLLAQDRACCVANVDSAPNAATETRTHYTVTDKSGKALGEFTRVVRSSIVVDRSDILFRSVDGDQIILEEVMSYATQSTNNGIRNIKGDARFALRYKLPFTGKTRDEILAEARRNPDLWETNPELSEIVTNGGSFRVASDEFVNPKQLRQRLRESVPFDLLEMIERTSTTIFNIEYATILKLQLVDLLLYRSNCAVEAPTVKEALPDCAFDKQFGFGCSEKQAARAKQLQQSGEATAY